MNYMQGIRLKAVIDGVYNSILRDSDEWNEEDTIKYFAKRIAMPEMQCRFCPVKKCELRPRENIQEVTRTCPQIIFDFIVKGVEK